MEIKPRLIWKENLDSNIVNDLLVRPNAGVAYVQETDKVYFNNVVLPQGGGPGPAEALDLTRQDKG